MELLLFILPVFFALSVLVMPQSFVRAYGLIGGLATLALTVVLMANYNPDGGMHSFVAQQWIQAYGITLHFGYDGISLMMLLLTTVLVPLILLSNFGRELSSNRLFTSMVFLMQLGLIGVFISLDGIWFYVFWEITLIPIFLIAYWFGEPERKAALMKFFMYTFFGSLFMLASLIGLKSFAASFAIEDLQAVELAPEVATWLMGGFFLAFAIKVPIFPFHTWQPSTYSKSPMAGTMLLSGIMLKMALYGMLRWMLPLFPEALDCVTYPIIILGTIGVVYGAILAIKQDDMKRLFAFASISHVGLIAAGIMTADKDTLSGSILQMINHGLVAVGLFLAADVIERRLGTRSLRELGGIAKQAPKFAFWFAALAFASVSVPFTSGFVGEFLILKGMFSFDCVIGIVAGSTLILGAVYTFRAYQLSMYGPVKTSAFADLSMSELIVFAVIIIAVVFLGVYPKAVIDFVEPSVTNLLASIKQTPLVP
ncbi:MAG TPA: NADH-quinone oxidoreductase subunit M [Fluviicola sp.]|nr:NADH-quinone oxidoreductase subunit M [Fluviicola sp.]